MAPKVADDFLGHVAPVFVIFGSCRDGRCVEQAAVGSMTRAVKLFGRAPECQQPPQNHQPPYAEGSGQRA